MLKRFTKFVSNGVISGVFSPKKIVNVEYLGDDNKTCHTFISPEEFELQVYFKSLKSKLSQQEMENLTNMITKFGDTRYNEGYDASEIDNLV